MITTYHAYKKGDLISFLSIYYGYNIGILLSDVVFGDAYKIFFYSKDSKKFITANLPTNVIICSVK
jgi:hypothetical protein